MLPIQQIEKEIVKNLEPLQPERIILFGLYANCRKSDAWAVGYTCFSITRTPETLKYLAATRTLVPRLSWLYEFQGSRSYSNCCYAVMSEMVTRASRLMLPFKPLLMAASDDKGSLSWSASLDAVGSLLCGVLWSKFETLGWSVVQMELLTQKGLFNIESES